MRVIKTEKFEHDGKEYELKLFSDGWDFTVKAFHQDREANGYSYSVSLPTAFDLQKVTGADAIKVLFENARGDIRENNWERYVEAYLQSLNLKEDQGIACRKCTSRDIAITTVDGRKMFRCTNCGNIWYAPRKDTGPILAILDDITDGVINKGNHETYVSVLLNFAFPETTSQGLSFEDQLKNWCNQNYLGFDIFYQEDKTGKEQQMICFYRKLA